MSVETLCPECGQNRWAIREHESHVLHVDVDLDGGRVERTWAETSLAALLDARCDGCGHQAEDALSHQISLAYRRLRDADAAA